MIPLLKIRFKYTVRHKCNFFWFYLSVPITTLIILYTFQNKSLLPLGKNKVEYIYTYNDYIREDFFGENTYYYRNKTSQEEIMLRKNISKFIFLKIECSNKTLGETFEKYLKEKKYFKNVFFDKNGSNSNFNFSITVNYDQKNDGYDFSFTQKLQMGMIFNYLIVNSWSTMSNPFDLRHYNTVNHDYMTTHIEDYFSQFQKIIVDFLLDLKGKSSENSKKLNFINSGTIIPKHYNVEIFGKIQIILLILIMITTANFVMTQFSFTISMLQEKEDKLDKFLERYGINVWKYYLSWFVTYLVFNILSISVVLVFAYITLFRHIFLYFLAILLNILASFAFSFFLFTSFNSIKSGEMFINIIMVGLMMIGGAIIVPTTNYYLKELLTFLPHINFMLIQNILFYMQTFDYSWKLMKYKYFGFSFLGALLKFVYQILIYFLLSLFINGYKLSGLSFINYVKSYFYTVKRQIEYFTEEDEESQNFPFEIKHEELQERNKELMRNNEMLEIKNVSRFYRDLKAVKNWNGILFPGEIFALLGHNGAGKTTLIKMISGAEDPDRGDIFYNGKSIVTDKKYLFSNVGLCSQEDIYFPYLTVSEHLRYISEIKGRKDEEGEGEKIAKKINLYSKSDCLCKELSGGQKRKLCVALALTGGSKIVLLDEPTSGMDVMAKRELWSFLSSVKKDKIVILTTHSLDEAEVLGDRIGIMSEGSFICSGRSHFLKAQYPCGFNLNLILSSGEKKEEIFREVLKEDNTASVKISSKNLLSLNINPNKKNIRTILNLISTKSSYFFIEDFTLSSTTLEDVFLKVNRGKNEENKNNINFFNSKNFTSSNSNSNLNSANSYTSLNSHIFPDSPRPSSFCVQLKQNLKKNFLPLKRNPGKYFIDVVAGLALIYVFAFSVVGVLGGIGNDAVELRNAWKQGKLYLDKKTAEIVKKSYAYKKYGKYINFVYASGDNVYEMAESAYKKAELELGVVKSCIGYKESEDSVNIYNLYMPYEGSGYFIPNQVLSISSFLFSSFGISASIFSDVKTEQEFGEVIGIKSISEFLSVIMTSSVLIFSIILYVSLLLNSSISERLRGIKHLLYLSGGNIVSYWTAYFIVDYLKLIIYSSLMLPALLHINSGFLLIFFFLFPFSFSLLFFVFSLGFLAEKENQGPKIVTLAYVIAYFITSTLISIMNSVGGQEEVMKGYFHPLGYLIADITPLTGFVYAYMRIFFSYLIFKNLPEEVKFVDLGEIKIHRPFFYLLTSSLRVVGGGVFFFFFLFLAEKKVLGKIRRKVGLICLSKKPSIDNSGNPAIDYNIYNNNVSLDVELSESKDDSWFPLISEQNKEKKSKKKKKKNAEFYIHREFSKLRSPSRRLSLRVEKLRKTFFALGKKNIRAVNDLYLGLEPNEKFALLGFNGSGKSTIFKCITNEIFPDSGKISIFGKRTKTDFDQIRTYIGYCPQENPVFDDMTVSETLSFFSSTKSSLPFSPQETAKKFKLEKCFNSFCCELSGGNKRKLACAVSIMNKPKLLLLDEPCTGVDPESRRVIWRNINEITSFSSSSLLLSSHSAEEAEVLCDNVAWLKGGNFACVGNAEELKTEFGGGYRMYVKFGREEEKEGGKSNRKINELSSEENIENNNNNIKLEENIIGYNSFINDDEKKKVINNCYIQLKSVIEIIRDKCSKIELKEVGSDNSFNLILDTIKNKKNILFIDILTMKEKFSFINEISINMEKLENILTQM